MKKNPNHISLSPSTPKTGMMERHRLEEDEQWTGPWSQLIPGIPMNDWPKGTEIIAFPPFGGAVARFKVINGEALVSVYLDIHDRLAPVGGPYWEVYPVDD